MPTIEDMFATKAEAINSYQQDIKKLLKDLREKVDEILLLRKALKEITYSCIPHLLNFIDDRDTIAEEGEKIYEICFYALKDTQKYELLEECLKEAKENA